MIANLNDSLLPYTKYYSSAEIKKSTHLAFKNHPQFPALVDILSRKTQHHVILEAPFSAHFFPYFLEAFVQHLTQESIPKKLRDAELFYIGSNPFNLSNFKHLLDAKDQYILFVLSALQEPLPSHPNCRFIILNENKAHDDQFTVLSLMKPTFADILHILKLERNELEQFHHVLIPEDLLHEAYDLSERYLGNSDTFKQALLLLDSSAARAGSGEWQTKPVVSLSNLFEVLAHLTHIPVSHLHAKQLHLRDFDETMQQKIMGQEAALSLIKQRLKQMHSLLQQTAGPLGAFLFAGPALSGKKTAALALSQQLFSHQQALYTATIQPNLLSLLAINVQRNSDQQVLPLSTAVKQTPYGIFVFEHVEQAPVSLLKDLLNILHHGELQDGNGNRYHFKQTILIFTTRLGETHLQQLLQTTTVDEVEQKVDLIHLIMNERKADSTSLPYATNEIVDVVCKEISSYLPPTFLNHVTIIPFLPLNRASIEKIIQLQLHRLHQLLKSRYDIELTYAPEIIRFLVNAATKHVGDKHIDPESLLNSLSATIEHVIDNRSAHKNAASNQLFLHLNETGQVVRCDWVAERDSRNLA